ncbi:MAG: hypothetical protein U5L09_19530 [Bacteroidales bacterium]|nr:hypothetical protein [Bacteroidales bacterium]
MPWFQNRSRSSKIWPAFGRERKLRLFEHAFQLLTDSGYTAIGLDHFARPDDELTVALNNRMLHRNFQGYCTRETTGQVYAFGTSAISQLNNAYYQNTKDAGRYTSKIMNGNNVVEKVYRVSENERILREVINEVMCNRILPWQTIAARTGKSVQEIRSLTAISDAKLEAFKADGLIRVGENIEVTDKGRFFIRNIASAFDPLVQNTDKKFSKSI